MGRTCIWREPGDGMRSEEDYEDGRGTVRRALKKYVRAVNGGRLLFEQICFVIES